MGVKHWNMLPQCHEGLVMDIFSIYKKNYKKKIKQLAGQA